MFKFTSPFIAFVLIILSAHTCTKAHKNLSSEVFRKWTHSFEEDQGDIKTFRPSDYPFPLSRGREGFEIKENGEFIKGAIAPTDGILSAIGTWEQKGNNHIKVIFPNGGETITFEIISIEKDILKIKG